MKHETIVGTRLPKGLAQDLERIERIEQSDRSTTVRKLLSHAVNQWKLDYYAKQYGQGKLSMARAARDAGVSIWEMHSYVRKPKSPPNMTMRNSSTISRRSTRDWGKRKEMRKQFRGALWDLVPRP